ncbi:hypothetical protein K788_0008377 [Paraburkholderia caribensis MBA4]|uniref:Uncharacterized protein n=1 Tax=Paraburkholderia caribensis MBA4 TaxID=1323664 RepID=A0A0N7JTA3_9BURK|nr:hypothetical protein K788_0008377 [Paraburkholderia caribensis MBA4]
MRGEFFSSATLGWVVCFRWYPGFVSVLQALPFGVLVFSLASANC